MKTALCLYGQPRDALQKIHLIKENVVIPNNADVFYHTWYDQNDLSLHKMTPGHEHKTLQTGIDNHLFDYLQPKDSQVEKQIIFNDRNFEATEENVESCWPWSRIYDKKQFLSNKSKSIHSMWYSISRSIMLKELYSHKMNFTYDCVILSRFDVSPTSKIKIEDYDLRKIVTRNYDYPRGEVSDWFLFSNNDNMNMVGSIFYYINFHYQEIQKSNQKIWTNEAFLRDHIAKFGIENVKGNFDVNF